ncbi:hypothetical protein DFH07DRAFT_768516 [Mycena maculata]|uniref:Carbonic anhydrase n=1 Tax=Mycena maculata TaxID=230809 RepID=A0AAD7NQ90_9AGAR|nr:hypothetical protein DFH07DRAFT_768516 [Mycena maculata]
MSAHVIRNAGGVAWVFCCRMTIPKDELRSIIVSQRLFGTRKIAVFHHTGCGMLTFASDDVRSILKDAAKGDTAVATRVDAIDSPEFKDLEESGCGVAEEQPLILPETTNDQIWFSNPSKLDDAPTTRKST